MRWVATGETTIIRRGCPTCWVEVVTFGTVPVAVSRITSEGTPPSVCRATIRCCWLSDVARGRTAGGPEVAVPGTEVARARVGAMVRVYSSHPSGLDSLLAQDYC